MTDQARTSRVLIALIVSMTIGAMVLMALDKGAVNEGAFSLSLVANSDWVMNNIAEDASKPGWRRIEVFYSNTCSGDAAYLALLDELPHDQNLGAHFVICNGSGNTEHGEIQATDKWKQQQAAGKSGTIRICVVANGIINGARLRADENQVMSTNNLVKFFCNEFDIPASEESISFPTGWQL